MGWRTGIEPASAGSRPALVARRVPPPRSDESPRPESNRIFPLTGRALVHTSPEGMPRLQRKESNLRVNRLTAGCLTIRLRWNTWTEGHGADPWPSVVRRRVVNERCPPDGGPISFGGRDRTCIAGSRGQRPAIRRPRSADTRSPYRRGSARADLRLEWPKNPDCSAEVSGAVNRRSTATDAAFE